MAIHPLEGVIQHYDWGGTSFLPDLLGFSPSPGYTYAEYWLGVHAKGPARAITPAGRVPLPDLISEDPDNLLGPAIKRRFSGQLPFLLKLLDVQKMLSIQVHPGREQATAGFRRENQAGIPLEAPHRNYRDPNHKPEIMVALTPFWLLHGFRDASRAAALLRLHPELEALADLLEKKGLEGFYRHVMTVDQSQIDVWLHPLAQKLVPAYESGALSEKGTADYWAAKAMTERRPSEGRFDRGIFSIYLLNLLALQPGQGIYQGAGILHAYLEGVNVELMANSDNVFRGGLTGKHVDIPELLKTLDFSPVVPRVLGGVLQGEQEMIYPAPVNDFALSRITLQGGGVLEGMARGPEVLLQLSGRALLNGERPCSAGQAFFLSDGTVYQLKGETESVLFRASCPFGIEEKRAAHVRATPRKPLEK